MKEMEINSGSGGEVNNVRINIRMIGPSPPSSLDLHSPIKVRDLRNLIAGNGRFPLDNLRLVLQGNVLLDTKYGDDVSVHFNNGAPSSHYGVGGAVKILECEQCELKGPHTVWRAGGSDLHEWCNDYPAVSDMDPVKLNSP